MILHFIHPDNAAWLIPVPSNALQFAEKYPAPSTVYPPPIADPGPGLFGYHMRVRGHLGDPFFAKCTHAERIFVVSNVVQIYDKSGPPVRQWGPALPVDYQRWLRYSDKELGYSFSYPPDWTIETAKQPDQLASLTLRAPQWPEYPIQVRVAASNEVIGHSFQQRSLRALLQLDNSKADFYGQIHIQNADRFRESATVTYSSDGKIYEFSVTYPVGIEANNDIPSTYTVILATFQPEVTAAPAVVAPQ